MNKKKYLIFLYILSISPILFSQNLTSGDWVYQLVDTDKARLIQYIGDDSIIYVPNYIDGFIVTNIGQEVFGAKNPSITNVNLPDSIKIIEDHAFQFLPNLISINIPDNVTYLGQYAFYECTSLETLNIPASVSNYFSGSIVANCTSLTHINVNSDNQQHTSIDGVVFNKSLDILIAYPAGRSGNYIVPESVHTIGWHAFMGSNKLTNVILPDGLQAIWGCAFWGCSNLHSILIPDRVSEIGISAFFGCSGFTNLTIPDSVISIGPSAFWSCSSLVSVILGKNVQEIGESAFTWCTKLTSVLFMGDSFNAGNIFGGFPTDLTVYYLPNKIGWGAEFAGRPSKPFHPRFEGIYLNDNAFQLSWSGTGDIPLSVQRAESLLGPWTTISEKIQSKSFSDSSPPNRNGFYRLVLN